LDDQFAEPVFTLAEEMLNQWSKQILEAWIGNFAKLLPILAKSKNGLRETHYVNKGINMVQKMSQRAETLTVRTCCALLIGAIADQNSLLSVSTFNSSVLPTVKNICQDFNWEVRKEVCGQLPFIAKYMGKDESWEHIYPELQELLDDEEREVVSTAIQAFTALVEEYLSPPDPENNAATSAPVNEIEVVRARLNA